MNFENNNFEPTEYLPYDFANRRHIGPSPREMEKMLNDYLQFAKTQAQESSTMINLNNLLSSIIKKFNNNNLTLIKKCFLKLYQNYEKNIFTFYIFCFSIV